MKATVLVVAVAMMLVSIVARAAEQAPPPCVEKHVVMSPKDLKWVDGPASLGPGAKMSVLDGDPGAAGLFTVRLTLPDGFQMMPHSHPADEHVTVLAGSIHYAVGDVFDLKAARAAEGLGVGSFSVMPKGTPHFAVVKGETVLQVHAVGPWRVEYVRAEDDPRGRTESKK